MIKFMVTGAREANQASTSRCTISVVYALFEVELDPLLTLIMGWAQSSWINTAAAK